MASSSASVKATVHIDNVAPGTILMWNGLINTIPDGWHICDGTAGTIDLRQRFVMGAVPENGSSSPSNPNPLGTTGGANSLTLTTDHMPKDWPAIHDPGHGHGSHFRAATTIPLYFVFEKYSEVIQPLKPANPGVPISMDTNTTGVTISRKGTGKAFDNTPANYPIYYIQKL